MDILCGHEVEIRIPASINRTGEHLPPRTHTDRGAINTTVIDADIK